MQTRRGSVFHKVFIMLLLMGVLPAGLFIFRLLTLAGEMIDQAGILQSLAYESVIYIILLLAMIVFGAIFLSWRFAQPIRQLLYFVTGFRNGQTDESIDIRSGDEVEELAAITNQMARELIQLQENLEISKSERARDLEQRAFQLQIVAQIAQGMASSSDLIGLLDRTVKLIQERFDYYYIGLFIIDDPREYAVLRAATGEAGHIQMLRHYRLGLGDVGIVNYVANTGEVRIVNEVDNDFVFRRDVLLPQTRSEAALPLRIEANVVGVLDVHSATVNAFTDDDIASLMILADQIAVAIQYARMVSELENRIKEINLYQSYTRDSWTREITGDRPPGYQDDMSEVVPIQERLPNDLLDELRSRAAIALQGSSGSKNPALIAPLKMYEQLIGVIGVESDQSTRDWTPAEIALIEAVSNQVALALDNARLLEATQKRAEQLRLLQEITSAAASNIEAYQLLGEIAQRICEGYNLLQCSIVLFDPDTRQGTLMGIAARGGGAGPVPVGEKIPLHTLGLVRELMQNKEVQVINLQQYPRMADIPDGLLHVRANSQVFIPLLLRGNVIGMISMNSENPAWILGEDDLQLLNQIGLQTANAIDIARSFEVAAKREDREKMMAGITSRMRETLDVEMVLQTAVNEIYRAFNLEAVAGYLVAEQPEFSVISDSAPPNFQQQNGEEAGS